MNRRSDHAEAIVILTLVLALVGAACSDDATSEAVNGASEADYTMCTEPAESWTDVTGEDTSWRDGTLHVPWADESGCAVRLDSVWHRFGDEHCGWQQVGFISFGLPMGTPYTGPDAMPPGQDWEPMFFFNEGGAVGGYAEGEVLDEGDVPASAVDTGLSTSNGARLLIAEDESVLYMLTGGDARIFVQPDQEIACA